MSAATTSPPASIRAYSPVGLRLYDALVMGVFARRIWRCSAERLVEHYRALATTNHVDIGVGTGYCLDRCGVRFERRRLTLVDLQGNCLEHAARRLARFDPRCFRRDVLRPLNGIDGPAFGSVALGGVLHCLAGDLAAKVAVLDNIAPLVAGGTRIFGYTLVSDDVLLRAPTRLVHRLLNRARVIDNARDRVADLHAALTARYADCRVDLVGCMALFSAVVPVRIPNH